MKAAQRRTFIIGGVIAFLCVALGAFGAHAFKDILSEAGRHQYDLGIRYAFIHAFAIMFGAFAQAIAVNVRRIYQAEWFFLLGIILFSGSLVLLAITGIRAFAYVTPFGGFCFLLGWVLVIVSMRGKEQ